MDSYLILKLLHILSAVVVSGTGVGIAFFMFMANRSNNAQAMYITARNVILGDWIFTTPAVITVFVTGLMLMDLLNYSFSSQWFYSVIGQFILIGLCWLPVLRIQYGLREMAKESIMRGVITPEFKYLMHIWALLGIPALMAILVIFWLMVFKPLPVT